MTTFTTEDKEEAYRKKVEEAPYHPGYEDAVVYPTVIVDSGASASIKTLADYIEQIKKLEEENASLKRQVDNLMDGRC